MGPLRRAGEGEGRGGQGCGESERKGEHSRFLCERSLFLPELCECEPLPAKAEAARLTGHEQKRQSASSVFSWGKKNLKEKQHVLICYRVHTVFC